MSSAPPFRGGGGAGVLVVSVLALLPVRWIVNVRESEIWSEGELVLDCHFSGH